MIKHAHACLEVGVQQFDHLYFYLEQINTFFAFRNKEHRITTENSLIKKSRNIGTANNNASILKHIHYDYVL